MGTASHLVQVEIFGQTYNLRGDADPAYILELAELVDRRMREVSAASATVDSVRVAILAALNIADEGRREVRERDRLEKETNATLEGLVTVLDRCLKPEPAPPPSPGAHGPSASAGGD